MEGAASRAQDWLALSTALAQPVNSDWTASGGLAVKLRGVLPADSPAAQWLGTMDLLNLELSPAYINQPVRFPNAHIEFAALQRTVTLSAAEAFGTAWHGTISRKNSDKEWTFDLSADHIDAADLDRWLGPRARPGFLARLTGSNIAVTSAAPSDAVVTQISARGRLRAAAIDVSPMHLEKFDGEAELSGRAVRIRKAQADFFAGKISGSFDARLLPDPSYEFQGRFDRVDLEKLARAVPFLNTRIGGNASATLALSAHGVGRQDLIASMRGQGTLDGRNVMLRGFNFSSIFAGNNSSDAPELFTSVQGDYRIQNKGIDLTSLALENSRGRLQAEGHIDFSHALNMPVHSVALKTAASSAYTPSPGFLLGGTVENPRLVLPSAAPKPPARPASR